MRLRAFISEIAFFSVLFIALIISASSAKAQVQAQLRRFEVRCPVDLWNLSMDSAIAQIGTIELTGMNDGRKIEGYLHSVGLTKGNPYCVAGIYWSFTVAAADLGLGFEAIPLKRTGLASALFNDALARGKQTSPIPQMLDIVIWKFSRSVSGHAARIINVGKAGWITTVEFNTSPNNTGSQREGGNSSQSFGGVFKKQRNIHYALGRMNIRGFIGRR